jgi:DnaJ like chaperone protein
MAWWGAGIGGTIGMVIGGPIGAIIGAGIGSSMTQDQGQSQGRLGNGRQKEIEFLVATFSMLGKIAKADGIVSADEISFINTFIDQELELDGKSKKIAIEIFNRAKDDRSSIYQYAQQCSEIFQRDDAMRETLYRVLFMTALADGHLHPAEQEILQQLPLYLQIRDGAYERLEAELLGRSGHQSRSGSGGGTTYSENLDQYYKILGLDKNATDAEIKSAYRKKAQEYHPDKLASKGLPEGFTKFATEQMTLFSDAVDKIMKGRKQSR